MFYLQSPIWTTQSVIPPPDTPLLVVLLSTLLTLVFFMAMSIVVCIHRSGLSIVCGLGSLLELEFLRDRNSA